MAPYPGREKFLFREPFYTFKLIILPRQARDKRRKRFAKHESMRFLTDAGRVREGGGVSTSAHPRAGKKTRRFAKPILKAKTIILPKLLTNIGKQHSKKRSLRVFLQPLGDFDIALRRAAQVRKRSVFHLLLY
eukprot:COSAG06_NODE_858_length_11909_cov_6.018036_19_plen_133_part_00